MSDYIVVLKSGSHEEPYATFTAVWEESSQRWVRATNYPVEWDYSEPLDEEGYRGILKHFWLSDFWEEELGLTKEKLEKTSPEELGYTRRTLEREFALEKKEIKSDNLNPIVISVL